MMRRLWGWIRNEDNREAARFIAWIFGGAIGLTALVAAQLLGFFTSSPDAPPHPTPLPGPVIQIQISQMANTITDEFIASPAFFDITGNGEKPLFIIGHVRNDSSNENVDVIGISNQIAQRLLNTGAIMITVDDKDKSLDYFVSSKFSNSVNYTGSTREETIKLCIDVLNPEGRVFYKNCKSAKLASQPTN